MLRFDTVYSGELSVSANADGTYCMELPAQALSEEVPDGAGADSALIQVLLDECLLRASNDLIQHTLSSVFAADCAVAASHVTLLFVRVAAGSRGRQWPGGARLLLPGQG